MESNRRLLLVAITLTLTLAITQAENRVGIDGSRAPCFNEGEIVDVDSIKDMRCFTCICKNGFVECQPERCPRVDNCFLQIEKPKNECCSICKGCTYLGITRASYASWSDPSDSCRVLRCEAGVITMADLQCYTPCDRPVPPKPGQCCPTCPGCIINGQLALEEGAGRDVTTPEDPCLRCHCSRGRLTCAKRACPVLQCSSVRQIRPGPGECCPKCADSRQLLETTRAGCVFGNDFHAPGKQFRPDPCTVCECINGTTVCERATCPVLECPLELQTRAGACCPTCPPTEQASRTCGFQGNTYQDGETWQLDPCKSCQCRAGEMRCAMERCPIQEPCPPNTRLQHQSGHCCPKCLESDGVCTVFGDPHYRTFDGKFYTFRGSCKYQLTADCSTNGTFSVRVTNDVTPLRTMTSSISASSRTRTVTLRVADDIRVNLGQRQRVKVNGHKVDLPFHIPGKLSVEKEDGNVKVGTGIGIMILWDGASFLEVSAPTHYKGKLCGLCGNFNSIGRDDLTSRRGKMMSAENIWRFGNSWRVGGKKACSRQQDFSGDIQTPSRRYNDKQCDKHTRRVANRLCRLLKMSETFGSCDHKLNPQNYHWSCLQDMCECPHNKCYCEAFTAYSQECRRLGISLPDWRNTTDCFLANVTHRYWYNRNGHAVLPDATILNSSLSTIKKKMKNSKRPPPPVDMLAYDALIRPEYLMNALPEKAKGRRRKPPPEIH